MHRPISVGERNHGAKGGRSAMGVLAVILAALAAACGGGGDLGGPSGRAYQTGYVHGCDTALAEGGAPYFTPRSESGFFGSSDYGDGWDEGRADCSEFWRLAQ